jgi:hypothetical protein
MMAWRSYSGGLPADFCGVWLINALFTPFGGFVGFRICPVRGYCGMVDVEVWVEMGHVADVLFHVVYSVKMLPLKS